MPRQRRARGPRVVIDTSVLIAGISGFRQPYIHGKNRSADLLYEWARENHFVWLYTEDILAEYKEILRRLRVRPAAAGAVVNLLRERAEAVQVRSAPPISPDPGDDAFCLCAAQGNAAIIYTLNPKDFPQGRLKANVLEP